MNIPIELILKKLHSSLVMTEYEVAAVRTLPVEVRKVRAGHQIVSEGTSPTRSCVVLEGVLATSKTSYSGNRGITAVHVKGDMPDLFSLLLQVMDCDVAAITKATVGYIKHRDLLHFCDENPRLARALWRNTIIEAAIYREWVINIGQREAPSRIAHLLCEMFVRLRTVSDPGAYRYALPLTQKHLGEMTGISTVHTNRVLQELKAAGLVTYDKGEVEILRWDALAALAEFDATYLHQPDLPENIKGMRDRRLGPVHC